ncbi:DNA-binding winged helix-turn-helix (wHTH) protein [Idiomarina loihiensis]|uniref:winged helix-turn-helix domain-containing protein n=1 Tax=Idiomarina TaxID=135575 RepID=UPI000D70C8F3|nr:MULTISPECIES: winged helix-turn-helix domain-containing protein [Idiomarina]PWW40314.1 DNA-binding winged helix-turn-helix (wHTH) protein [Idiomarina loihiensis]TDP50005.1 DNA-binding winged helix-turn-helix (wHTH) protein [Idiomarina loihiensis]TDS24643.1 DNA-binding winged helix-turn-helix (wHTH) protein [Idiomarina sp. H2]
MLKSFNEYRLDLGKKILFRDGEEVEIEPLTMQVLLYLIDNNTRYVDIEELHNRLWINKVVSDSAIRRTIVKLRAVLGDDSSNPTYIKSASRRGYRFICQLEDHVEQLQNAPAIESAEHHSGFKRNIILVVLLAAFLLVSWYTLEYRETSVAKTATINMEEKSSISFEDNLLDLFGRSATPTRHGSKPWLAFAHKIEKDSLYNLFLLNLNTKNLSQLTSDAFNYRTPLWVSENELVAIAVNGESCSLVRIELNNKGERVSSEILHSCNAGQLNLNFSQPSSDLFFSDRDNIDDSLNIFRFNLIDRSLSRVSSPANKGVGDYISSVSPNGDIIAFARTENGEKTELLVEELNSGELVNQINLNGDVTSLYWLSDSQLVFLNNERLSLLNIIDGRLQTANVPKDMVGLYPNRSDQHRPFAIRHNKRKYLLQESRNPFGDQRTKRIITFSNRSLSAAYSQSDDLLYYLYGKEDNRYIASRNEKYHLRTVPLKQQVQLLAVNPAKAAVLLQIGRRLAEFSLADQDLQYLTRESDDVQNGTYNRDGSKVLYAIKISDSWSVYAKDLNSAENELFIPSAIAVKAYRDGYLAILEDYQLARVSDSGEVTPLADMHVHLNINTAWAVGSKYVYYSKQQQDVITLYRIDLDTFEETSMVLARGTFDGRFAISRDGSKLVLTVEPTFQNNIYKAILPFE